MMDELHASLSPRLSAAWSLSQMVEEFGDANQLPDRQIGRINLALDELNTDTMRYGLRGVARPKIESTRRVSPTSLVLTCEDNGQDFDPTRDTKSDLSSAVNERSIGDPGLHLIKTFTNHVQFEYVDGKNRLTLEYDLTLEALDGVG